MSSGWWIVVQPGAPPAGPYSEAALKGLLDDGQLLAETHVWCEGRTEWKQLSDTEELRYLLQGEEEQGRAKKSRRDMSPNTELEMVEAQLKALEEQKGAPEEGPGVADAPQTPEELEFEDDDGTTYVWDTKLRKYMPKGGAVPGDGAQVGGAAGGPSDYDLAAMTFEPEDELIPTLAQVKAAEAQAEEELQNKDRKKSGKAAGPSGAPNGEGAAPAAGGKGAHAQKDKDKAATTGPAAAAAAGPAGAKREAVEGGEGEGAEGEAKPAEEGAEGEGGYQGRKNKRKKDEQQKPADWFDLKINTNVYVTGLPLDVTVAEVAEAFGKCGIIKVDEQGRPRIKLYTDKATGQLKGDALVSYLKEPSVKLACDFLNDSYFRANMGTRMTVEPAKFEMKGERYQPKAGNKKKKKQQLAQLEQRALGWGGFDDRAPPEKTTVVLKNMFVPDDFLENMLLSEELEKDVRSECGRLGVIEKVRIFKHNPEGVVTIRYKAIEPAQQAINLMNGRYFGGRKLEALMWDGFTNYNVKPKETAEEEAARLEAFARELEAKQEEKRVADAAAAAAAGSGAEAGTGTGAGAEPAGEEGGQGVGAAAAGDTVMGEAAAA